MNRSGAAKILVIFHFMHFADLYREMCGLLY